MATNRKNANKTENQGNNVPVTANNAEVSKLNPVLQEKMDEIRSKAQACIDSINGGETDQDVIKTRRKSATKACVAYNMALSHDTYKMWTEKGVDPVLEAITERYIPGAKKIVWGKNDDGTANYKLENDEIKISLFDLQGVLGKDVFTNPEWSDLSGNLALLFANKLKRESGSTGFEYDVTEAAKAFNFDEATCGKLYSNGFFCKALQVVFDAIKTVPAGGKGNSIKVHLKEDDNGVVFSPAWNHVAYGNTRNGKGTNVTQIGDYYKFTELVVDCMHNELTDKSYELELFK